ncbi:MAG: tetratricopeptide repeat family protein [Chitinophagaceae bacterium]|jgi:Tfp pilus assembly protein PilF|nr:tetratricopeptide repeat family protein [Chitinophagaceae bacterium]
MKKISLLMLSFLVVIAAMSQNVNEGIKQLYYQKNNTAKQTLQKAVDANPTDATAIYWLGQAHLTGAVPDIDAAKAVYQKALNSGVNQPMVWVGMGHVALLQGQKNEARQHFEAAITASLDRKKNPSGQVLAAIGRANADGASNIGDPLYGIEKLTKAAELVKNDPEIYINMGILYQKLGGERGGDAVQAYNNALAIDPRNAKALFRIGRIYESQNNQALFDRYYSNAVTADPQYTPTYLALYDHYKDKDVTKALGYLQEFNKYAEPNPENEYFMADYLFRAGKYQESLTLSRQLEAKYGLKALPMLNVLYAYNYDRLGDSVQAKTNIEKYFASAKQADVLADFYMLAGTILSKFPGSEEAASGYFEKAFVADSLKRPVTISVASEAFKKAQKYDLQYNWFKRGLALKPQLSEYDHYTLNDVSFRSAAYQRVFDSLAPAYIAAFPDKPQGYAFHVRAAKALDSTGVLGLAIEPINKQNEYLVKDTAKNRKAIYLNYYYQLLYYGEKAKVLDLPKAIGLTEKMMALYPTGTEEFTFAETTNRALQRTLERQRNPPRTNPPKTTGGNSGTSKPKTGGTNGTSATKAGTGGKS